MNFKKNKKKLFIFFAILGVLISCYFFFAAIDSAISKKYEVFNPTESHHYSTLTNDADRINYVNMIEHNNLILNASPTIYFVLSIISLIAAFVLLIKRKED